MTLIYDTVCQDLLGPRKGPSIERRINAEWVRRKPTIVHQWAEEDRQLLAQLRRARVHVVSAEAMQCVLAAYMRLPSAPSFEPYVPDLWIEFEEPSVTNANGASLIGVLVTRTDDGATASDGDAQHDVTFFFTDGLRQQVTFVSTDAWEFRRGTGRSCAKDGCPIAEIVKDVLPSRIAVPNAEMCTCCATAALLGKLVATTMALLSAEGVAHRWVEAPAGNGQRVTGGKAPDKSGGKRPKPRTQRPPRWIHISLSERVHVLREGEERSMRFTGTLPEGPRRLASVAAHPRLLIPGPTKP